MTIAQFKHAFLEIERRIMAGSKIKFQDDKWHMFDKNGDGFDCGHLSLFELITAIANMRIEQIEHDLNTAEQGQ